MNELIRAADYAAGRSDRWLFIFILLGAGVGILFFVRWLIGRYEQLMAEHRADQQQFSTALINITAENNKTARELAVVLDRCAGALEENNTHLRLCRETHKQQN
jgi:hypothetical protein